MLFQRLRSATLFFALITGLAASACREAPPVLKVACQGDTSFIRAVNCARDSIERSGSPVKVDLVFDNAPRWSPAEVIVCTDAFCREPGLMAVIGFTSSDASLASARMLNRHEIVQIVPTATSPKLDDTGPWTFRLCPGDEYQAEVLASTALETLGAGRCALLYQNNDYGRELATLFRRGYEDLGGVISFAAQLGSGFDDPTNLDLYVRQVIESAPDLLVLVCQPEQAEVVQQELLRRGSTLPLLGSDSLGTHSALLKRIHLFEGMYVLLFYHHDFAFPGNADFVDCFRSNRGGVPGYEAALAHDALLLLHQAVLEGARTSEDIRDWLAALVDRPPIIGVAGPIRFHRGRQAWRPLHLAEIRNGEVHLVSDADQLIEEPNVR